MTREEVIRDLIATYRKRIETLQDFIKELQAESGAQGTTAAAGVIASDSQEASGLPVDVKEWQFMGKSQPEAAKVLLALAGRPLTTEQIIEGIRKGGVEVGGGKFTFYNILARSDDVVRFRRNTWGLTEWPGAPKKKIPQPRKQSRRAKRATVRAHTRKAKKQPDQTETASE
jgi:hypothetical protein